MAKLYRCDRCHGVFEDSPCCHVLTVPNSLGSRPHALAYLDFCRACTREMPEKDDDAFLAFVCKTFLASRAAKEAPDER